MIYIVESEALDTLFCVIVRRPWILFSIFRLNKHTQKFNRNNQNNAKTTATNETQRHVVTRGLEDPRE